MSDQGAAARAAILAGTLDSTILPDAFFERDLYVPPIRRQVDRQRPPLDLNAAIFIYRRNADGRIEPVWSPAGARNCRAPHRRYRA